MRLSAASLLLLALALPASARRAPLYQRGVALYRQGKLEEAVAQYRKALAKAPGDAALLTDLGLALGDLGKREEAELYFRRAIEKAPQRWYAYVNLADLVLQGESRWERHDEIAGLLADALLRIPPEARTARVSLTLAQARFDRATGRAREARGWLDSLADDELTARQRDAKGRLYDAIAADERARALEEWPEPEVTAGERAALQAAERLRASGAPGEALHAADALVRAHPTWRAPRWLRAQSLQALLSVDDASSELSALVRLSPAHAEAWRLLGEILAADGGMLEADRADEALRNALALEPSWVELWLTRAKVALRRGRPAEALHALERAGRDPQLARDRARDLRALSQKAQARLEAQGARPSPPRRPTETPPEARELFRRAQELLAKPEREGDAQARESLEQALQLAPGFLEAAATLFSLTEQVSMTTVQSLWDDGPALLQLAGQVQRIAAAPRSQASVQSALPAAQLVRPWIDRAVLLHAAEALLARAQLRAREGDRAGALADLAEYVAGVEPQQLAAANQLRDTLTPPPRADAAQVQARLMLTEDRPADAETELGARCDRPPRKVDDAERLLGLGKIREYRGELEGALACYRAALLAPSPPHAALARLARLAARVDVQELADLGPQLEAASAAGLSAADWALARTLESQGRADEALGRLDRFLGNAADADPSRKAAAAARDRLLGARTALQAARQLRLLRLGGAAALLALAVLLLLFHGSTVESALRSRPSLFPAVARAVAEIRHDVIKHRASVLGALADPAFAAEARADVARSLLSPTPTSQVVARIYQTLRLAARAQGVQLRRLGREPVFGALARDLRRAEAWLSRGRGTFDPAAADARLRELHSERLAAFLKLGPRTRLDAPAISSWIRDVEAELRRGGAGWTSPALQLPGMEVEFPVERAALATIFTNLLRNAQAVAQSTQDARVLVRLGEERDAAGRRLVTLTVGDSSPRELTLDAIEERESGRGLAIVRDLTREWHGHVIVRGEADPWKKSVGACFVAPQEPLPS